MPALPLLLFLFVTTIQDPPASPCATWADCREQALAAAAAEEYERFHDLAWEAVRKGRRNDPELMLLLARAQSLSGRPLDALVMLRRLADLGAGTEAIASDDFRRVRALPGWAELERRLLGLPAPGTPPSPPATTTSAAAVPSSAEVTKKAAAARATSAPAAGELLRFRTPPFIPGGLAYDRVSRRFIVGDRDGQRLAVVDEFSHQIATLAGSKGAGFGEIAALEIDPRDGALWVISNGPDGGRLHKLQLISARAIGNVTTAPQGPSRFVDLALGPPGTVLVLDDATPRVLRMRAGGGGLTKGIPLGDREPTSLSAGPGGVAFVAHARGIARIELATGEVRDLKGPPDLVPGGLVRLGYHDRTLVGLERTREGFRAIRLRLTRDGRGVTAAEVLDDGIDTAGPSATSIVADTLYYLAQEEDGAVVIRRVRLR